MSKRLNGMNCSGREYGNGDGLAKTDEILKNTK